ncbi:MAG: uS8 family ribosomal protein [Candidatus Levyibacteriota bacterium]
MNYIVSDLIIQLKNASLARRKQVTLPYSRLSKDILQVLIKQGFVASVKEQVEKGKKTLVTMIAYEKRMPVMNDVTVLSKPSLRKYAKATDSVHLKGRGLGILVVSTSKGVMTGKEAFQKGVGGELLFKIW